jgi:Sulfotransferase family
VFLFGAAHSGTTILYRMVAYHPELAWPSQFSLRAGEVAGRRRVPGANRLDRRLRAIPHRWRKGESGLARRLAPRPGEARTIWEFLLEDAATSPDRVRSVLTVLSRRLGGRRVVAKLPAFHQHLDLLGDAFPQARFVHIVRDGRAVAVSLRPKFERTLDADGALEAAARHWVEVLEQAERSADPALLQVRYEDFCADVHGMIRATIRHAGLDAESFPFSRCPRTLSNRNDRRLAAASGQELARVSRIQDRLLRRHGYTRGDRVAIHTPAR